MSLPRLDASSVVVFPVRLYHGNQWLFLDPVKVFMKTVKDNREKLLGILLICVRKLLFKPRKHELEVHWSDHGLLTRPKIFNEFGIGLGKQTLRPEGILRIQFT